MTTVRFFAGDTKVLTIQVFDAAGVEVNITGATSVRFQVFGPYEGTPLFEKSLGDGITLTAPQVGIFDVALDPEDTDDIAGFFAFEAEVIVTDIVSTVVRGYLDIERTQIGAL